MKMVIIEDNPEIVEAVSLCFDLRWPESQVLAASQGIAGVDLIEKESPDIVILDIGLPDIDGFEVCRRVRLFSEVPVVMLTARDHEMDKVKGLELGADDYINKPFSHVELLARVKAVMRRSAKPDGPKIEDSFAVGKLRIEFEAHQVFMAGKEVKLTATEYNVLCMLARNAGKVTTHQVILEKIWGLDYHDSPEYLKVYIQRLRTKLGDNLQYPRLILSERGVGYKLAKPRHGFDLEDELVVALR